MQGTAARVKQQTLEGFEFSSSQIFTVFFHLTKFTGQKIKKNIPTFQIFSVWMSCSGVSIILCKRKNQL